MSRWITSPVQPFTYANVLCAVELDLGWAGAGVHGYAVHPGVVVHVTTSSRDTEQLQAMALVDDHGRPIIAPQYGRKTVRQGVATIVFAAVSPLLVDIGDVYLKDCDISLLVAEHKPMTISPDEGIPAEVAPTPSIRPPRAGRGI